MKDLKSTILEKLDINKVNLKGQNFVKNFPLDDTIEKIANYLKANDFKEIPWPEVHILFNEFKKDVEKENGKVFTVHENRLIRFANTSDRNKISDDNPIFVINTQIGQSVSGHLYFENKDWWQRIPSTDAFLAKMDSVFGD